MAKAINSAPKIDRKYEVEDALRTLTRAYEVIKDKSLMSAVKKLAGERAEEMEEISDMLSGPMKMGLVSDKARDRAKAKVMDKD
jgi:hypothetical protein